MARGRIIINEITKDKRINELSSDTSRLAFTWLVTFADIDGRTYGDPALVRSMIFPRRDDISVKQVETLIQEWHDAGLIVWYEAQGDKWIYFPSFYKHQQLRRDKEAPSHIPPPPELQDEGRSRGGVEAELPDIKLKEKKLIKDGANAPSGKDPRTVHPAIQAIFKIVGRYPAKDQYDVLIEVLGEKPDADKLRKCWSEWRAERPGKKPFSPMNFGWVTDWYKNGIPGKTNNRKYSEVY